MKPYVYLVAAITISLTLHAPSAVSAELRFGSIEIQWLDGFKPKSGDGPIAMAGPQGEELLVSVFRISAASSPEEDAKRVH